MVQRGARQLADAQAARWRARPRVRRRRGLRRRAGASGVQLPSGCARCGAAGLDRRPGWRPGRTRVPARVAVRAAGHRQAGPARVPERRGVVGAAGARGDVPARARARRLPALGARHPRRPLPAPDRGAEPLRVARGAAAPGPRVRRHPLRRGRARQDAHRARHHRPHPRAAAPSHPQECGLPGRAGRQTVLHARSAPGQRAQAAAAGPAPHAHVAGLRPALRRRRGWRAPLHAHLREPKPRRGERLPGRVMDAGAGWAGRRACLPLLAAHRAGGAGAAVAAGAGGEDKPPPPHRPPQIAGQHPQAAGRGRFRRAVGQHQLGVSDARGGVGAGRRRDDDGEDGLQGRQAGRTLAERRDEAHVRRSRASGECSSGRLGLCDCCAESDGRSLLQTALGADHDRRGS